VSRYEYIDSCRNDPSETNPVTRMCVWLAVSTSGFYHWLSRPASATAARREALTGRVKHFFTASDGTYGYRRVHADLADEGTDCSPELVRQIMRAESLVACQPRPFRVTTDADAEAAADMPDLVERDFTADRPGVKFVGDITYVHTWQGFVYLATVIDCYSKKVVGWSIADHMRTELVEDALRAAARDRGSLAGAVFHSDHGSVYTSKAYVKLCKDLKVVQSMGAIGTSADNSLAESFNAALKRELLAGRSTFPDQATAYRAVFRWANRYNTRRRHSAIGNVSPNTYEAAASATLAEAA
jgi:transposase InsO family protein